MLLVVWLPSIYHYHYVKQIKHNLGLPPLSPLYNHAISAITNGENTRNVCSSWRSRWSSGLFKNFPRLEGLSFKFKRNCKRLYYSMLTYTVQVTRRRSVSFRKVELIYTVTQKIRKLALSPYADEETHFPKHRRTI